jgi:predicted small lipoprotein YifL
MLRLLMLLLLSTYLLSGCGQIGPLYLPEKAATDKTTSEKVTADKMNSGITDEATIH